MAIIIRNALAVLPQGDKDVIGRHTIYIKDDLIVGIDERPEEFPEETAHIIDGTVRLVIPGLINAHTHTYMSMMRNCADDLSFMDWLFNRIDPIEGKLTPEDAYWGSLLGQIEMIRSGTTTFNDMQMHIHQTTRAVRESGMRAVICRGLVGDAYDKSDMRLQQALEEMEDGRECSRLSFRLGPHAPYTCGPDYLRMVADVAKEKGLGIHIHLGESVTESENMRKDHDCTPIEYALDAGIFEVPTIAAHCVQLTDNDIKILADHNVSVVTNPASNMKLGNGFAPVPEMMEAGINVCLGTDGAASNNAQNMFREMGYLSMIHKGTHRTPQCIGAGDTEAAEWYIRKLTRLSLVLAIAWNIIVMALTPVLLPLYDLTAETKRLILIIVAIHNLFSALVQPFSGPLSSGLRAAGDVKFTMWASIFATVVCRTFLSFLLAQWLDMGVIGIALAMVLDWCIKAALDIWRFRSGKWKDKKVI